MLGTSSANRCNVMTGTLLPKPRQIVGLAAELVRPSDGPPAVRHPPPGVRHAADCTAAANCAGNSRIPHMRASSRCAHEATPYRSTEMRALRARRAAPRDRHLSVKCLGAAVPAAGLCRRPRRGQGRSPVGGCASLDPGCGRRFGAPVGNRRRGGFGCRIRVTMSASSRRSWLSRRLASRISIPMIRPSSQSSATNPSTPSGVAACVVVRRAAPVSRPRWM
jgi:hypothetical protein